MSDSEQILHAFPGRGQVIDVHHFARHLRDGPAEYRSPDVLGMNIVQQFRRQQGKYAFVAAFPVGALVAAGFVHHQVNVGRNFQRPAVKGNFITPGAHRERL